MATNTCRINHFSRLSASDENCLILEVIFCSFLLRACRFPASYKLLWIVYLSILWISMCLTINKQEVITISFLTSEIIIYNNIKLYDNCIIQLSFSSYFTSESQLVAFRSQRAFESMFFILNCWASLF